MIIYRCPSCGAMRITEPPYNSKQRCKAKLNGVVCKTYMLAVSVDGEPVIHRQRPLKVCRSEYITVYLTEDEKRKVKQVAKNKRITMSELVVDLLKEAKYI